MRILFTAFVAIASIFFTQFASAQDVIQVNVPSSSVNYTTVTTQEVGHYAVIPNTVQLQPVQDYYFVNVDNSNQVCKTKKITTFKNVAGKTIRYGKRKLYCYPSQYFTFQ